MPTGFNWGVGQYPTNIIKGTSGCIDIQCKSITSSIGTFPIVINATANTSIGSFPYQITGYKIQVKFTNVFTANQSSWYSQNEWLLNYDSITYGGGNLESYPFFIMKDSLAKQVNDNSAGGFDTIYNNGISFGSVIDVCDRVIDYAKNPFIKASKLDSAYLDSISFPYIYIRNTDSIMVGSFKRAVVDTLIVSWYSKNNLTKYYFNTTPIRVCAQPTVNNWDFSTLMQTNFFKRDTILLTKTDTTSLYNNGNGIPESAWTNRTKYLKAPLGMFANAIDAQKLFGFTVNFKSGVSAIDTGIMIYQGNPTNLPSNLKRPNYFGASVVYDVNQILSNYGIMDSSYTGGLLAMKTYSYQTTNGWKGYIPSNAWNNRMFINSSFKVRSKNIIKCAVSDSIICKGKTVTFNLSNCNLFNGTTNLGTGIINQTPLQTKVYQIKSNGVTIATITISVIDSLNIQRITSSDTLSFCGYNSKFLIGLNTTNSSPKNYLWYRNDTLLVGKTLAIDTFTSAGKYKVTLNTSTGCYQEQSFFINKLNSTFNPDFSVNKQIDSVPPFDFIFSNNTTPLADYNFTWKWGNGDSTISNNLIQFYTYSANGQYNVKLVAQNKITGCKDSIIKNNFITCSGLYLLSLSTLKTNPICNNANNGSINITANSGVAPYQYKLNAGSYQTSNSFTNLSAGIYTVYVKDASNTIVSKIDTLTNPVANSIGNINGVNTVSTNSTQQYSVLAQSGAIYAWNIINGTLLSGNGTNSIQVQWAGLAGVGKVMISLTKNACTVTDSLNIVINLQALDLNTSLTNPSCYGSNTGSISVIASGGFTPYQYKLNAGSYQTSNSFTNLGAGIYTVYVKDANNTIVSKIDTLINPIANSIGTISGLSAVATNSIQAYTISAQSGATYAWNIINGTLLSGNGTNSIQVQWAGLAGVGKVMITLTKNACTVTDSLNIVIGNPPLSMATIVVNPTCSGTNNGSITTNAHGGIPPYQYKLNTGSYQSNNSFSNLIAGIYTVYVKDASNNTFSKIDTINFQTSLNNPSISGSNGVPVSSTQNYNIASQNGVIYTWNIINGTLLSGNGTNSIQVQWAAVAGMGKVIANISKNACSAADTLVVSIGSNPLTSSTTKTDETCAGKANGAITINASGGTSPYQYSINNGTYQSGNTFNNLVAGIYVSKVKDASNVISQNTDTINVGPGITAGAMNGPTSVALSALSTYIIGQQTGLTYLWNVTNGIVASGQGTNIAQVSWGATAGAGMVKVKVTSAAGCVDSTMLNVTIGSSNISNIGKALSFTVYPNPVKNELIITTNQKLNGAHIIITDMLGRRMLEENITNISNEHTILVNELKSGAYILSIQKEGETSRIKFVKE